MTNQRYRSEIGTKLSTCIIDTTIDPDVLTRDLQSYKVYECDISLYEDTYNIPKLMGKLVGLRHTLKDTPLVKMLWNIYYWFFFGNLLVVSFLELGSMIKTAKMGRFQDIIEIFRMIPCIGYVYMALIKSCKMMLYRPVYENLVDELRDMFPRGPISKEEYDVIMKSFKYIHWITKGCYWCNNFLIVFYLRPSIEAIYKHFVLADGTALELPFAYWFPFDPYQDIVYQITVIVQIWHGVSTVWLMVCSDLLFCVYVSHLSMYFDLLAIEIKRLVYVTTDQQMIPEYPLSNQHFSKEDKDGVDHKYWEGKHKQLGSIVLKHRALIRLSGDVEAMFSFSLLVNFINSSIVICFCGFCAIIVEKIDEMVYKSFLTTAITQTWLLCWYGERLMESSGGVSYALYSCGWYRASKKIKSCFYIMLLRSRKYINVTTYGFSVLCLGSYANIIKTSWSYFTLLINIFNKEDLTGNFTTV